MNFKIHASSIVMRSLDSLLVYDQNARTHPQAQIDTLAKVIEDSGFTTPLLIEPSGRIIAGHGRALAARQVGMEEVPCVVVEGLSAAQIKALRISDNQVATKSGWDLSMLKAEMSDLRTDGFDLDLTGFTLSEVFGLFANPGGGGDPNSVPEAKAVAVSRPGDVWVMGKHRLLCGDSCNPLDVGTLMAGGQGRPRPD